MTLIGSTLYGTTQGYFNGTFGGDADSDGTVFSVPVTGGTPTTLARFNFTNGASPNAGLTVSADGGTFYGTTGGGGVNISGTVFSVPVGGGTPTDLVSFSGANGIQPYAGLTLGTNGILYGTTGQGGTNNDGTVFSLTPNAPAAVPEASSVVSFGLLLAGGLGAAALRARRKSAVG